MNWLNICTWFDTAWIKKNHYIAVAGDLFFIFFFKKGRNRRNHVTFGLRSTAQGALRGYGKVTEATPLVNLQIPLMSLYCFFYFFLFQPYITV